MEITNKKVYFLIILSAFLFLFTYCEPLSENVNQIDDAYNFPNPFSPSSTDLTINNTTIRTVFINNNEITKIDLTVKIYDVSDALVWYFNEEVDITNTSEGSSTNLDVSWAGNNNEGDIVSQGIYYGKITLTSIESLNGYGGDTLNSTIKIAVE